MSEPERGLPAPAEAEAEEAAMAEEAAVVETAMSGAEAAALETATAVTATKGSSSSETQGRRQYELCNAQGRDCSKRDRPIPS